MKTDINAILNKLVLFAEDELMLDALDETYTLNKLAALVGITPAKIDADYGDATLSDLLDELKAAAPDVDPSRVTEILMPLPHTVNYYFNDAFSRNREKAFDFVYDLFATAGYVSATELGTADGYCPYGVKPGAKRAVTLLVGEDDLKFTPLSKSARAATLECRDFMSDDIARREAAFADTYGMVIAKRVGSDDAYVCASAAAVTAAKTKETVKDGVVKISVLDYAVPALSVKGPKNSAAREAAKIIKAAAEAQLPCVIAAAPGELTSFYIVFAADVKPAELFAAPNALNACGVFGTAEFAPLISILEKGTALSTDLFEYKPLYSAIGGVKLGAKAVKTLTDELVKRFKPLLAAAASCDEAKAKSLVTE